MARPAARDHERELMAAKKRRPPAAAGKLKAEVVDARAAAAASSTPRELALAAIEALRKVRDASDMPEEPREAAFEVGRQAVLALWGGGEDPEEVRSVILRGARTMERSPEREAVQLTEEYAKRIASAASPIAKRMRVREFLLRLEVEARLDGIAADRADRAMTERIADVFASRDSKRRAFAPVGVLARVRQLLTLGLVDEQLVVKDVDALRKVQTRYEKRVTDDIG